METWDLPISKEALLTVLDEAKLDLKEFPTCEYYASRIFFTDNTIAKKVA